MRKREFMSVFLKKQILKQNERFLNNFNTLHLRHMLFCG